MNLHQRSFLGYLCAAAIACGALTGCGGSSSSVSGQNPTVHATGGVAAQSGTSATTVSNSTSPQQVQITQGDGTTVTAFVPPGESFNAGDPVAVLPANQPFINGLTIAPSQKKADGTNTVRPVYVDGQLSGAVVNVDGTLSGFVILTRGTHTITTSGPFDLGNGINTLTIGSFSFGVTVDPNGNASIPSTITMRIPANGGSTANGNFVTVNYPTPAFSSGAGTLIVSWPGVTKTQKRIMTRGKATFSDPLSDTSDRIPSTGVSSITFNWSPN